MSIITFLTQLTIDLNNAKIVPTFTSVSSSFPADGHQILRLTGKP
ncbi:hypothetical protein [Calothrix sp. UHCC 0171]|nr:hypothetical protein [Calothrix sp. UHCC 0171]MEA5571229.1 hypothetical protein [Calothrix sp. UHCC 0171]